MSAPHLAPGHCYVCGGPEHDDTTPMGGHRFWSNKDAEAEFRDQDRLTIPVYSNGTTTPEANYVAQHRPY